jgi:hypothetical protein
MQHFYDGQIRRYLTQFIRALSGFSYKDGQGNLKEVPVRFGTANIQAASILRQNSENFLMQAPFISVYINNLELSRSRMQDPTHVSKVHIRERDIDENGEYTTNKGADVTVERLMPNPYQLSLTADIWTTNIDQKLQILEQIIVLFNPAIEFQTTSSYLDWTSLTTLELMDIQYTNQVVPSGSQELEIASLTFMAPIWLSAPAKVKRMGVITSIIARVFDEEGNLTSDILNGSLISQQAITIDGYGILITNNATSGSPQYVAKLLNHVEGVDNKFDSRSKKLGTEINWREVIDRYPGKFTPNLSKIQLTKADNKFAMATISLNTEDETLMNLTFDNLSLPTNTLINSGVNGIPSRGTIDAIVDPNKPTSLIKTIDSRYLILDDITTVNRNFLDSNGNVIPGVEQWGSFEAKANDIIMWDGTNWRIIFNSSENSGLVFITNAYTGVQYKWDGSNWTKSMEGIYPAGRWQIIL